MYTNQKGMSIANSIHHSNEVYNYFKRLKLGLFLSDIYIRHLMTIIISVFLCGYKGKTVDFAKAGFHHRTTISHFLNHGKWNSTKLEKILKANVVRMIYQEAILSRKPILCIVDDTIASHTKPSSQAENPIEAAYFHQSHLKGCQDYGHQAVSVMLSCNGITLNYAMILYDKSKSKIQIVQEIAEELPPAPVISYFLCDSWYTSAKVMDSFIRKGFYTIGALKTNRIIYPCGIRQKVSGFALHLRKEDPDVSLVTVDNRNFYVYRYEGELNDIPNAVVIISYPENAFGEAKALRVFLSTNAGLSTQEILDSYTRRWPIEIFFRQSKTKLALDKYQIRTQTGIERYWLIMSLVHYMCCTCNGTYCSFEEGYQHFQRKIREEQVTALYQSIRHGMSLEDVLKLAG
ncbi:MAG: transposase [Lachnospiraceae bacterium]|nr:transposase [Lachnospiraceae bacterium]